MSVKLSAFVWDGCARSGVKGTQLLVLARLADFSSDEGSCYPGIETIARQIGAGRSTVITAITALQKGGWLKRQERRTGQRNKTNMYYLNVRKLREAAAAAGHYLDDSIPEPSESEHSEVEHSESGYSESVRSESEEKGVSDSSESGGDPSVNSKHDPSGKKPLCQPAAQTDPEVVLTDSAKQILSHLNQATGSRYQVSKSSLENIRARLAEGFTTDELILTTDYLNAKWANDLEMAGYLRPTTIFQPSKFQGYLTGAQRWLAHGRPACVDGKWVKDNGETVGRAPADHTERDAAWRRFIGSAKPVRNPSQLEETVRAEASKAGVRSMNASFAVSRWNSIWKECENRLSGGKAA